MNVQEGINEARRAMPHPAIALPYRGGFADAEKGICAFLERTRYDVLCWHERHAACHWVSGAIAHLYKSRVASDFSCPYTPIRWR